MHHLIHSLPFRLQYLENAQELLERERLAVSEALLVQHPLNLILVMELPLSPKRLYQVVNTQLVVIVGIEMFEDLIQSILSQNLFLIHSRHYELRISDLELLRGCFT